MNGTTVPSEAVRAFHTFLISAILGHYKTATPALQRYHYRYEGRVPPCEAPPPQVTRAVSGEQVSTAGWGGQGIGTQLWLNRGEQQPDPGSPIRGKGKKGEARQLDKSWGDMRCLAAAMDWPVCV